MLFALVSVDSELSENGFSFDKRSLFHSKISAQKAQSNNQAVSQAVLSNGCVKYDFFE